MALHNKTFYAGLFRYTVLTFWLTLFINCSFFGDFSQPSFSSFELPSLDLSIKSQREIFGPGPGFQFGADNQVPRREGRVLDHHGDHSELGGEGGVQGSYQWWSAHPVLSWSSQQFHGA